MNLKGRILSFSLFFLRETLLFLAKARNPSFLFSLALNKNQLFVFANKNQIGLKKIEIKNKHKVY
jgi:hypothetical protein